jgi:hypothetical protein
MKYRNSQWEVQKSSTDLSRWLIAIIFEEILLVLIIPDMGYMYGYFEPCSPWK